MYNKNNFFAVFGLAAQFDIDLSELTSRYRELQTKLHPDKFASSSGSEQAISVQQAAMINDAYNTLKSPLTRAKYLLELNGIVLNDETNTIMDPEFLMQQMELRESLASVKQASDPMAHLDELSVMLDKQSNRLIDNLSQMFQPEEVDYKSIAAEVRKMQFYSRLHEEMENLYSRYEN